MKPENTMKDYLILLLTLFACLPDLPARIQTPDEGPSFEGYQVTPKGAWCWFADPRALHHESKDGSIDKTYIGYIDVHGNIKAMQTDWKTNQKKEVLIRSWFQPDDHNNPTFLVLPDDRVMVFYSRHTDEACFYYRVSHEPGDITTLGEEKIIRMKNNTTYPSPFILSDDPEHIYLCWRGINWHPTIGRLLIPDSDGNTNFDWGPYQLVQSTGARPYAKYASNGKDKIYMTYTTGHPDNEYPNDVYFNEIDIRSLKLKDIKGKVLATIQDGPHHVNKQPEYAIAYPNAVVEHSNYRNWVWEVALDAQERPVIAMVCISADKKKHDYYHVRWTGTEWKKTFLAHAGGHFHQTPDTEQCYSGGISIDKQHPQKVYGSVPVKGKYGTVYEIMRFTVKENGDVEKEAITSNSQKNNSRPYHIPGAKDKTIFLGWMYGDYYDWIVSARRPLGYCTAIRSITPLPERIAGLTKESAKQGRLEGTGQSSLSETLRDEFSVSLTLDRKGATFKGGRWDFGNFSYGIDGQTLKPFLLIENSPHISPNVVGNSDNWKYYERTTNGKWLDPKVPDSIRLCITYGNGVLRTYIDGLLDQSVPVGRLTFKGLTSHYPDGISTRYQIYERSLSQEEIKQLNKNE